MFDSAIADWACIALAVAAALLLGHSLWTLLSGRSPSQDSEGDPPNGPARPAPVTVRA